MIEFGFIKDESAVLPEDREDLTAKMITLLTIFGGLRVSEPFHIWFNDVVPQTDDSCKVFLRHPAEAYTEIAGEKNIHRKTYLAQRNLRPRNDNNNSKSYKAVCLPPSFLFTPQLKNFSVKCLDTTLVTVQG